MKNDIAKELFNLSIGTRRFAGRVVVVAFEEEWKGYAAWLFDVASKMDSLYERIKDVEIVE